MPLYKPSTVWNRTSVSGLPVRVTEHAGDHAHPDFGGRPGHDGAGAPRADAERGGGTGSSSPRAPHMRAASSTRAWPLRSSRRRGLGREGDGLIEELKGTIGKTLLLSDGSDEAGLLARVGEALRPAPEANAAEPNCSLRDFAWISPAVASWTPRARKSR